MASPRVAMDAFFTRVQPRAYRQILSAVKHREDTLDLLQDAMLRLAKHYANKEAEWEPIFYRILQNLIRDYFRKKKVRRLVFFWQDENEQEADLETHHALHRCENSNPYLQMGRAQQAEAVVAAFGQLPLQQQQAFALRAWWGHDVRETAAAMGVTEGTVKTHYSRALQKLRGLLGESLDE